MSWWSEHFAIQQNNSAMTQFFHRSNLRATKVNTEAGNIQDLIMKEANFRNNPSMNQAKAKVLMKDTTWNDYS